MILISKFSLIILLIVMLFIGILIGKPGLGGINITQDEIDEFENELENGTYIQKYKSIEPNIINSTGRKVEDLLDSIFGFLIN